MCKCYSDTLTSVNDSAGDVGSTVGECGNLIDNVFKSIVKLTP